MAVQRVPGVESAEFSYPEGRGRVTFDTTRTSAQEITDALARATGFVATEHPGG